VPIRIALNPELFQLALGLNRIITYTGYVLLAGTLAFWSLVWPDGQADRRLVRLALIGTGLMVVGTISAPLILMSFGDRQASDVLPPILGTTAAIIRLAILVGIAFFLIDLIRSPMTGWRRPVALAIVALLAATLVAQSDAVGGSWEIVKIVVTVGHVLAVAAWLGGLVALAAVVIPGNNVPELERLIPRFSIVAVFSVVTLVITGPIHALAIAGGTGPLVNSRYGLVLLVKVVFFGLMLAIGNYARMYASRLAFTRKHLPGSELGTSRGRNGLALVIGAELMIAFVILSTTSILVMVAPQP
jgi:putative copper export protein